MRCRHIHRTWAGIALATACLASSSAASADVSSWLFVGGGPAWGRMGQEPLDQRWVLQLETGMGTPPSRDIIVGGLLRTQTNFGDGTDLSLSLRLATHGFVNGDWGAALDLGGYQRWWGPESTGFIGGLSLGAPWGITLSATALRGTESALGFAAVLGIDLARLTVYRRSGSNWWKNPFPAYRPEDADLERR